MLAGVTDYRRSQKWGCKGRWVLGFKPRLSSHIERGPSSSGVNRRVPRDSEVNRENHAVLKEKREDHEVLGKGEDHASLAE